MLVLRNEKQIKNRIGGLINVVLTNEIKGRIVARGLTQSQVAEMLGITQKTFSSKLEKGVFTTVEIEKMVEILQIKKPWEIFFADEVTYKVTKEEK